MRGELKAAKDGIRGIRRCPECGAAIADDANVHFTNRKYNDYKRVASKRKSSLPATRFL